MAAISLKLRCKGNRHNEVEKDRMILGRGVLLILALWLCLPHSAHSQVNTEKMRLQQRGDGLAGAATVSFDLDRGNSDVSEAAVAADLLFRRGRSAFLLFSSGSWLFQDKTDLVNKGFLHLRYNHGVRRGVIGEVFAQVQYDRSQDLRRRYLLGAGARLLPLDRRGGTLAVGVTPMYEFERLTSDVEVATLRISSYVSGSLHRAGRYALSTTTYFQPAADRIADLRILNETQLVLPITSLVSLTTTVSYRYDSEPPMGVKEYDLSLSQGIKVSF